MSISEFQIMSEVIIPYLEENWDLIDNVECAEKGNGRLTKDKLFFRYLEMMTTGKIQEAIVLELIIERYTDICSAHEDAYIPEEEEIIGITEEDISVYTQKVDNRHSAEIRPYRWLPARAS